jgi:hypothetical protein
MAVNVLDLAEDLKARTDLSEKDARGIVRVIATAVDSATDKLVTREYLDAHLATLRAGMHEALRSQTIWLMSTLIALTGFAIAAVKLFK